MNLNFLDKISKINQIVLESKQAFSEQNIIAKFVNAGIEVMEADYGYFFGWNENLKKFELTYQDSKTPFESKVPRKDGVTAQAFEKNEVFFISNAAEDSLVRNDAKGFMKGVVVIPVIYKDTQYGILDICFYNEHIFTPQEKILCEFIGNSAAQVITIHRLIKKEQEARLESEAQKVRFRAMIENSYDVIALLDRNGIIIDISNSAARMSGYALTDLLNRNIGELIHTDDIQIIQNLLLETLEKPNKALILQVRYRHNNGSWRWLEASGINKLDDPNINGIIANIRDITERKDSENIIQHQALHDPLTGLPNRQEFSLRFNQALEQANRNKGKVAVMFLDMDRFKNINDTLGHNAGDSLLKVVATRLSSSIRAEDVAARFGGDEFLVLVNEVNSSKDIVIASEKILKAISLPVKIGGHTLYPSASIGIAIYPDDGLDLANLKKNADIAMYRAKENGRNRFSLYDSSLNSLYQEDKFTVENEFRVALLFNQIIVNYQPIINLKTQKLIAMEALARWNHPDKGILLPRDFIPLAEESGLIAELDKVVLKQACIQAKVWQEAGFPKFRVAVNLSAQQFSEPEFVNGIANILAETGLDGSYLELEITESLAMSNLEITTSNLKALKKLDIYITIDDFGTGYSSLSYLKRFPIHGLKIDRSFVRHCITSPADTSITKTIIAMAQTLNLKVTAEGVENIQQLDFLKSLGCDGVQGFFIAKPMIAEEVGAWLELENMQKEILTPKLYQQ